MPNFDTPQFQEVQSSIAESGDWESLGNAKNILKDKKLSLQRQSIKDESEKEKGDTFIKTVLEHYRKGDIQYSRDLLATKVEDKYRKEIKESTREKVNLDVYQIDFSNKLLNVLLNRLDKGQSIDLSKIEVREVVAQEVINSLKEKYKQEDVQKIEQSVLPKNVSADKKQKTQKFLEDSGYLAVEEGKEKRDLSSEEIMQAFDSLVAKMEKEKDPEKIQQIYNEFINGMSESLGKDSEVFDKEISEILDSSRYLKFKKFEQYLKINGGVAQFITEDGQVNSEVFESSWKSFEDTYMQNEPEVSKILFKKELEQRAEETKNPYKGVEVMLKGDDLDQLMKKDPILQKLQTQESFQTILNQKNTQLFVRENPDGVPVYKIEFSDTQKASQSISFTAEGGSNVVIGFSGKYKQLNGGNLQDVLSGNNADVTREINDFYARSFIQSTALDGLFNQVGGEDADEQNDPLQFLLEVFNISNKQVLQLNSALQNNLSKILAVVFDVNENTPLGDLDRTKAFSLEINGRSVSFLDSKTGNITLQGNEFFKEMYGFLNRYPAIQTQRELFLDENFATIITKY